MLPDLKRDADGGLTLYISHNSPGPEIGVELASGTEWAVLADPPALWPQVAALEGTWIQPPLEANAIDTPVVVEPRP